MATYDVVLRGGTIVDGTSIPQYRADLAIKNGRVALISGRIKAGGAQDWMRPAALSRLGRSTCTRTTTRSSIGTPMPRSRGGLGSRPSASDSVVLGLRLRGLRIAN